MVCDWHVKKKTSDANVPFRYKAFEFVFAPLWVLSVTIERQVLYEETSGNGVFKSIMCRNVWLLVMTGI